MDQNDFANMTDEEIVRLAQRDKDGAALEYLLNKYKNFVRAKARSYFLIGADHEDIVQEGMIGLYKAIRDYREDRLSSFRAFAELCVTRQIITAIKTATRQKHIPLNSYISLNRPIYEEDSDRTLLDVITEDSPSNPEEMLIDREDLSVIEGRIGQMLSDLEISADARLRTLSKGTKEKVQLILVMSRDAKLYILDEPIGGVDPAARDYILHTILANYNEESTILLSTHLIHDIENILDRVVFLKEGRLAMNAPVDDIRMEQGRSVDTLFREVFRC